MQPAHRVCPVRLLCIRRALRQDAITQDRLVREGIAELFHAGSPVALDGLKLRSVGVERGHQAHMVAPPVVVQVEKDQVAGLRRIALSRGVQLPLCQELDPGLRVAFKRKILRGDLGEIQAERDEHGAPIPIGETIPSAVAGVAVVLPAINDKVPLALGIAELRPGHLDQVLAPVAGQLQVLEHGRPLSVLLDVGGRIALRLGLDRGKGFGHRRDGRLRSSGRFGFNCRKGLGGLLGFGRRLDCGFRFGRRLDRGFRLRCGLGFGRRLDCGFRLGRRLDRGFRLRCGRDRRLGFGGRFDRQFCCRVRLFDHDLDETTGTVHVLLQDLLLPAGQCTDGLIAVLPVGVGAFALGKTAGQYLVQGIAALIVYVPLVGVLAEQLALDARKARFRVDMSRCLLLSAGQHPRLGITGVAVLMHRALG